MVGLVWLLNSISASSVIILKSFVNSQKINELELINKDKLLF